jgi:hypothetical protein
VASLRRSIDSGSLSDRDISQAQFREQVGVVTDLLRQITGDATISAGNKHSVTPLATPFVLHVDPLIGSDRFVSGFFNDYVSGSDEREVFRSTVNRLSHQRLVCGYSAQRPFRTINRAVLEAAMLQALPVFEAGSWQTRRLQVLIRLAPGVHELLNTPGSAATAARPRAWIDGHEPSREELMWFNAAGGGGILLPRGVRIVGADRDATVLRPLHVPGSVAELDSEQRGACFAFTGQSAISQVTFSDAADYPVSHHLLDLVQVARASDLERFYGGVLEIGQGRELEPQLCRPMGDELHFGPAATDTTGASVDAADGWASLRDCRLLSAYGLGGVHADGRRMGGLQRLEVRNLVASSNQRDLEAWQLINPSSGEAERVDAVHFQAASAAALQPRPGCSHTLLRASHGAQVLARGIEAEGFSYGARAEAGAAIEIDGVLRYGVWGLSASGYRAIAHRQDCGWHLVGVRAPQWLEESNTTLRWLELGRLAQLEDGALHLAQPLEGSTDTPAVLRAAGYSLTPGSLLWLEAADGRRWSVPLAAAAWSSDEPARLVLDGPLMAGEVEAERPRELAVELIGARVRLRRLVDGRSFEQRAWAALLAHTQHGRLPAAGQVLRLDQALPGAPLLPQPAATLQVQHCFVPRWSAVGQLRTAAVVLTTGGAVAQPLLLDDDRDTDPCSCDCGWPLGGSGSWSDVSVEAADRDALALLLEAAGCGDADAMAAWLEPKPWWEQEQLVHNSEGPVVLALHEGSRIAAEQLLMREMGYGNRSKGELAQQTGVAPTVVQQRQVQCSDGGWVTLVAPAAHC